MKPKFAHFPKTTIIKFLFVLFVIFSLHSCQKDETISNPDEFINDVATLKSAEILVPFIDDLILKIENYVTAGELDRGIANSLISKLQNAKKTLEKGNDNAAMNQLQAVMNQLEDLIALDTIDPIIGDEILDYTKAIAGEWEPGQPFLDLRDAKMYKTVVIGTQCWMAENLAYLPAVSPPSGESFSEPYYYVYDYMGSNIEEAKNTSNYLTYGVLYNWPAALASCPEGWHLPSDAEWKELEISLGMLPDVADFMGYRGTDQGVQMKSTFGWYNDGNGDNISGFSALPGGIRSYDGRIGELGIAGRWWTSTKETTTLALRRRLVYNRLTIDRNFADIEVGISVRCVKGNM